MEFNVGSRKVQIKRWLQRFILHFKRKEIRLQISGRLVKSIINTLSRIHKYHSTLRKTKQIWRFPMDFCMIYVLAEKTWISANITQARKNLELCNNKQPQKTYICKKLRSSSTSWDIIFTISSFQTLQKQIIKERF